MLAFSELAISKGVATKDEARSTTLKNIVTRWLNVRFLGGGGLEASPRTDADGECELRYQPEGWGKAYEFITLRCEKKPPPREAGRRRVLTRTTGEKMKPTST